MNRAGDIVKRLGEVRAGWRGWELFRDWVAAMSLAFRSSVSTGAAKNDLESEYATEEEAATALKENEEWYWRNVQ